MSDITGDAITVHAAEDIVAAIEPVGTTSANDCYWSKISIIFYRT